MYLYISKYAISLTNSLNRYIDGGWSVPVLILSKITILYTKKEIQEFMSGTGVMWGLLGYPGNGVPFKRKNNGDKMI